MCGISDVYSNPRGRSGSISRGNGIITQRPTRRSKMPRVEECIPVIVTALHAFSRNNIHLLGFYTAYSSVVCPRRWRPATLGPRNGTQPHKYDLWLSKRRGAKGHTLSIASQRISREKTGWFLLLCIDDANFMRRGVFETVVDEKGTCPLTFSDIKGPRTTTAKAAWTRSRRSYGSSREALWDWNIP